MTEETCVVCDIPIEYPCTAVEAGLAHVRHGTTSPWPIDSIGGIR